MNRGINGEEIVYENRKEIGRTNKKINCQLN
jgi:hypothetical protein